MKAEIYKEEVHKLMGAAFEVYNDRGHGLGEKLNQECLGLSAMSLVIPGFEPRPGL